MPWKECHTMDERVRFVARLLDGEKMATGNLSASIACFFGHQFFATDVDVIVPSHCRTPLTLTFMPDLSAEQEGVNAVARPVTIEKPLTLNDTTGQVPCRPPIDPSISTSPFVWSSVI